MSIRGLGLTAVGTAMLLLSGCGKDVDGEAPKGQVIATADGMEITQRELAAEMDLMGGRKDAPARRAALQQIIARKLLAREARERKLDERPDYGLLKQRAEEMVLELLLQRAMTRNLPEPGLTDAEGYMADNPDQFGQRKIFAVEQIRVAGTHDKALLAKLRPLASLDETEQLLNAQGIRFHRGEGSIDALQSPPEMVRQLLELPPGEIFILPGPDGLTVNRIREVRTEPVDNEEARRIALDYLRRKAVSDTLKNQLAEIMKKNKEKIRYQPGYAPEVASAARSDTGG